METEGVFFSPGAGTFATVEEFKAYLIDKDPYADFLTHEEYAQFKNALAARYVGVGLELERDRAGGIRCYPDPDGPAAGAGIAPGDRLLVIDGQPVAGRALPSLVALAAGPQGTRLVLEIADRKNRVRHVSIVRSRRAGPSVTEQRHGTHHVVRISSFTPSTRQELEFILSSRSTREPLIMDLRGNRGGDLNAAIDSAELFLPAGELVGAVVGKSSVHRYVSTLARPPYPQIPFIWQDHGTASSAELFVAALADNGRARSIGTPTYGKGTEQNLIELRSGAVLILTTGYLQRPNGGDINGRGIVPDTLVSGTRTDRRYLDAVTHLSLRSR